MSNQYNTAWQRTQRDRRFQETLSREGQTACARKITKVEWGKSSCTVYYQVSNYEYHRNIIEQVRKYAGRLNQEKRDLISKAAPEYITVIRDNKLCYMQGCPYNTGIRSQYSLAEDDIEEWIKNALS